MRLTGSRAYAAPAPTPTMPPGLVELMEGLAKDVLKHNPENVYEFCAGHMQKLLEIRDGPAPPKKQLSLEQKIVTAQEKIRHRIKYGHLQRDINTLEQSNENLDLEDKPPVVKISIESASAVDPILEISNENTPPIQPCENIAIENTSMVRPLVEIANENTSEIQPAERTSAIQGPLVEIANENTSEIQPAERTSAIQAVVQTVIENAAAIQPHNVHEEKLMMANEFEISHEPDVIITTNESSTDEASNPKHDYDVQSTEGSQVAHELKDVVATLDIEDSAEKNIEASQVAHVLKDVVVATLDIEDSTEKNIEDVKLNFGVDTKQISDIEANVESRNDTGVDVQSENDVNPIIESIEHPGIIPQLAGDHEAQLKESEPTISGIGNKAEGKVDNLNDGALKKEVSKVELNEVAPTPPLVDINDAVISHIDDTKTLDKNVVEEEKIVIKEELTDTQHEEILIKKNATKVEPEESVKGVLEKQEIIKEDESADIHPQVITAEKADQIESKESVDGVTLASEHNIVEQNHNKLLFQGKYASVEELTINQQEVPYHNETVTEKKLIVSSTDTEIPEISHLQIIETHAELTENQVITGSKTEQAVDDSLKNDDIDDQQKQVNCETEVDKQLSDDNDKLPEQERAYGELIVKDPEEIQDYTTTLNNNGTIIEGDETPESTAVSGMDLETAAITIQKVFRTFLFSKSRASTLDDTVNENSLDEDIERKDEPEYILTSSNLNKERRTLGISRMDTVLQTVNEEKSLSLSDDSSLSSAATTIQAHVRGFLVRNRLASNKTASSSSLVNSDGPSTLSLDGDVNEPKKTILNIHIVPERGQFVSRDESLLTSIDLPLDNSPPSSINLHPLGYDKSAERRKQLKREDAVQSISPPSNSGKLSEEVDSVKDTLNDSIDVDVKQEHESASVNGSDKPQDADTESCDTTLTISSTAETVVDADTYNPREVLSSPDHNMEADNKINEVVSSSDEMDVVTPYPTITEKIAKVASVESENDEKPKLVHSGEFHDIVVQTQVKRSESSVVRGE